MIEWNPVAQKLGYADEVAMWNDMYVDRQTSIERLAEKLGVSRNTIRDSLERAGIPLRHRGGPNNQKLDVTDELVEEIRRDGITKVATRLGLSYTTVYKRLYRVRGLKVSDLHPPPEGEKEAL